jgi:predicted enzyme involved in methoxymalonyl-ACP biosynthesis
VNKEILSVESLLLSCRVLGRTLEAAIMGWMVQRGASKGFRKLVGEIVPTERNTPVRDVYLKHGFQASGENRHEFSLQNSMPIPSYFTISG